MLLEKIIKINLNKVANNKIEHINQNKLQPIAIIK